MEFQARDTQLRRTVMPEYPDITLYIEHLRSRILNEPFEEVRLASPFFLRSVDVPVSAAKGKRVVGKRQINRILFFGARRVHVFGR
jgi:formamidopyrimidine-DNA glycosylase